MIISILSDRTPRIYYCYTSYDTYTPIYDVRFTHFSQVETNITEQVVKSQFECCTIEKTYKSKYYQLDLMLLIDCIKCKFKLTHFTYLCSFIDGLVYGFFFKIIFHVSHGILFTVQDQIV